MKTNMTFILRKCIKDMIPMILLQLYNLLIKWNDKIVWHIVKYSYINKNRSIIINIDNDIKYRFAIKYRPFICEAQNDRIIGYCNRSTKQINRGNIYSACWKPPLLAFSYSRTNKWPGLKFLFLVNQGWNLEFTHFSDLKLNQT